MGVKKTIIFDIDETLVDSEIFPSNLDLILTEINKLKTYNYSFGICTNRPLENFVKKVVDTYLIDDYIVCEGGAIVYKKEGQEYIEINNYINKNINKMIKKYLKNFDKNNSYIFNKDRKASCTIKLLNNNKTNRLISYLKSIVELKKFNIEKRYCKILISSKNIDKIKVINELYKNKSVIFVSDYESKLSKPNENVKIYSVGIDSEFNQRCHLVFNKSTSGVLEILLKEGEEYE